MTPASSGLIILWYMRQSSAKRRVVEDTLSGKYVLIRVSFGSKDCTKELKPECAYFLGQTS